MVPQMLAVFGEKCVGELVSLCVREPVGLRWEQMCLVRLVVALSLSEFGNF